MAYTINLTDGTVFAVIADGTINTSSSMILIGKNYAGYGDFLDENFMHLLENSANTTAPGAPLTGQLWWDKTTGLLKVYNGSIFKTISAATSSSTAPAFAVQGDLWYDTTNAQLKVYTGTTWLLVGPQFTAGTGVTGAIVDTIVDNTAVSHVVIKLFVQDDIVGIISKDGGVSGFQPQVAINGFPFVYPGITLSTTVPSAQFWGTASNAASLNGLTSTSFMRTNAATTNNTSISITSNTGLSVGVNSDARINVAGTAVNFNNQTSNGNINMGVNIGGIPTTALQILGTTGSIGILGINNLGGNGVGNIGSASASFNTVFAKATSAQYADVAERFAADVEMPAGTVVELGGSAEITQSNTELSDTVFGVISTQAAYLMNSGAGPDATHPPIAMTGRVPVRAIGQVAKGDRLVSAGHGLARSARPGEATAFNVIGRALKDKLTADEGMVEAIVSIRN
jgi:hypothetical protein